MDFNHYQQECKKTLIDIKDIDQQIIYLTGKLNAEAGELSNKIFNMIFHKKNNSKEIDNELGDVLYYFAMLLLTLNINIEDIMDSNINKLRARHGETYNPMYYEGENR